MKVFLLFLGILLVVVAPLSALSLDSFILDMFLQIKTDQEMFVQYQELKPQLSELSDKVALEYYMGRVFQSFDTVEVVLAHNTEMRKGKFIALFGFYAMRDEAITHYENGLALIDDYKDKELSPDLLALKADTISQLCLLKSLGYTMFNGLSIEKLAKQILKRDPNNFRALLLISASSVYPPPVYGGDPKKGIEIISSYLVNPVEKDDEILYNLNLSLAYCYNLQKEFDMALFYIDKALAIYPTNIYANAIKQIIILG